MEVSALKYAGGVGLHARSPLLRLQSDERLVVLVRRGNATAFEVLVSRYESRLLAFCRHLLSSREDAEDVLQEVFAAAFNAMTADERPINVRPWLYRIARNRSLNHLRRMQAIGVDSMDVHFSDHGASTADKVHEREEFRLLVGDIHELPETQKTALVLREMDALSYDQIAEAMETTVPSVKSLLVRARISLAEASEARLLSCNEVRIELGEIAEGLAAPPEPTRASPSARVQALFGISLAAQGDQQGARGGHADRAAGAAQEAVRRASRPLGGLERDQRRRRRVDRRGRIDARGRLHRRRLPLGRNGRDRDEGRGRLGCRGARDRRRGGGRPLRQGRTSPSLDDELDVARVRSERSDRFTRRPHGRRPSVRSTHSSGQ